MIIISYIKDKMKRKTFKPFLYSIPTALFFFLSQPQHAKPEGINVNFMQLPETPAYDMTIFDKESKIDVYFDKQTKNLDYERLLGINENIAHKLGANIIFNNDPIWTTTMGGVKYRIIWNPEPIPFIKNDFKTYAGYQYIESSKLQIYKAGQFFLGGEENLTGTLGKEKARIEATGTLGGYSSLSHKTIMWDNFKIGGKFLGTIEISDLLTLNAEMNYTRTKFNKEKYFFLDDLRETNYGINFMFHPSSEDIGFSVLANKNIKRGKEFNEEAFNLGFGADFEDIDAVAKFIISVGDESNLVISGSKYLFDRNAMLELYANIGKNESLYGLRFEKYFGSRSKRDRLETKVENYERKPFQLLDDETLGYTNPGSSFDEVVENTNTLPKIMSSGIHTVYGPGTTPARNPQEVIENGFGDCNELSWKNAYLSRLYNWNKSWDVGYYGEDPVGHAFFLVQDKDGRVYVTDNAHGVPMRVNVDKNASKEEMSDAAIRQLSNYLAMPLEEGSLYYWMMREPDIEDVSKNEVVGSLDDWKPFESNDPGYAPIDTGLGSRIGMKYFYGF